MRLQWRLLQVALGFPLLGIGVGLTIRAGLGVSAFDVLTTGVAHRLSVDIAVAVIGVTLVYYVIAAAVFRVWPGPASIANAVVIGPVVSLTVGHTATPSGVAGQALMYAAGVVILITGLALVVASRLGPGPGELLMVGMLQRFPRFTVAPVRSGIDALGLLVGALLGGAVGVGTVVFAVVVGPILAAQLRLFGWSRPAAPPAAPEAAVTGEALEPASSPEPERVLV